MSAREQLPNRCASTTFAFNCGPRRYVATVSLFPGTDRLAEIFLADAKDSAIVASIALQHGVPVDVARKALLRDGQGKASSPLGAALDLLTTIDAGRRR